VAPVVRRVNVAALWASARWQLNVVYGAQVSRIRGLLVRLRHGSGLVACRV